LKKDKRHVTYPRAILFGIFVFVAAILLNPPLSQIMLAHKKFWLSWNNIASIVFLILAICILFFPLEKLLGRKRNPDKELN